MVQGAVTQLRRANVSLDAGRIIAALPFGFWTGLFAAPYQRALWQTVRLAAVFPHCPARLRNRQTLWDRLDNIRRLRNRVSHHEPIWNRTNLIVEQREILETVAWVSHDMYTLTVAIDRFPQIANPGQLTAIKTAFP